MSNVLGTNEMAKNKVPDLLKDTLAITGIVRDVVKASPLNDEIPLMTEF